MSDQNSIVRYAIYPGIGVARVGNSPDEYFIGPEAPGEVPQPEGGYKDSAGRVKRQAARFRRPDAARQESRRHLRRRRRLHRRRE